MHQPHDERRIPLEFEATATPSERSFWATFLELFRIRRNAGDQQRQKAVERNHDDHVRDALRTLRQPGLSEAQRDIAMRVLGRAGSGAPK